MRRCARERLKKKELVLTESPATVSESDFWIDGGYEYSWIHWEYEYSCTLAPLHFLAKTSLDLFSPSL